MQHNKEISIRNVEPHVAISCKTVLHALSIKGLLKIFHSPIQSNNPELIQAMGRDVKSTIAYIEFAQELRRNGTFIGTNIIIDYRVGDKTMHNCDKTWLDKHFDYWA